MKSDIAHSCSGVRASSNDGMGVPLNPVVIVPEEILAGRPSPEGPTLREVRRAYRIVQLVDERLS